MNKRTTNAAILTTIICIPAALLGDWESYSRGVWAEEPHAHKLAPINSMTVAEWLEFSGAAYDAGVSGGPEGRDAFLIDGVWLLLPEGAAISYHPSEIVEAERRAYLAGEAGE